MSLMYMNWVLAPPKILLALLAFSSERRVLRDRLVSVPWPVKFLSQPPQLFYKQILGLSQPLLHDLLVHLAPRFEFVVVGQAPVLSLAQELQDGFPGPLLVSESPSWASPFTHLSSVPAFKA